MTLDTELCNRIEHAHFSGESIPFVVSEYERETNTTVEAEAVANFMKTLPPVCRGCNI